ncbi:MAG TPA: ABC transporter substrate-binding protein [Candidatus Eisenbacteria bacterium]|nr:ABC transporter substrate-binding protein [Candidatus Eisenbacteria bacterium]
MKSTFARLALTLTLTLVIAPASGAENQPKLWKIGVLVSSSAALNAGRDEALRQGLRQFGYVEGRNIKLDFKYAEGKLDRLPQLARELVEQQPDLIVVGGTRVAVAAHQATKTIPIVVAGAGDLVRTGLVRNFSFPGGNVTGISRNSPDFVGKRLEVFKQAVPKISRVAALGNSTNPGYERNFKEVELGARAMGIAIRPVWVRSAGELDSALSKSKGEADALFLMPDALFNSHVPRIVELTAKNRLPAIYPRADYVEAGGLMSYGVNLTELWRQAGWYVDQIIKGMKPDNLSLTEPTKFDLVINANTAKQLGLTIPPDVLARADKIVK